MGDGKDPYQPSAPDPKFEVPYRESDSDRPPVEK
jgi:hypothetical protein